MSKRLSLYLGSPGNPNQLGRQATRLQRLAGKEGRKASDTDSQWTPALHGLAAPVPLLELGKLRPETFQGSPLSQMNLSLTTGGDGNILHTEPLMDIRVAIKKEMRKGGGEDVGEMEERVADQGFWLCP